MSSLLNSLLSLPWFFTLGLSLGIVLLFLFLLVFPISLMIHSEKTSLVRWFQDHIQPLNSRELTNSPTPLLLKIATYLDFVTVIVGHIIAWLIVAMAIMQFSVVILRYVFSWGSVQMQESIWYMHGIIFTFCVGYTLYREGHVRIDVFYRNFSEETQAWINLFGVLVFVLPTCAVTLYMGYPYVVHAWEVMEGSTEGMGLHYVYLLKTSILVFATLLATQSLSLMIHSILTIQDSQSLSELSDKTE